MFKKLVSVFVLFCACSISLGADFGVKVENKVEGLELPPPMTAAFDDGFVTITATCKGEVKWLVIGAVKPKYVAIPHSNAVIVAVPPQGGTVYVYAVGLVDGKLTEYANTTITVTKDGPAPNDPTKEAYHITFVLDMNNTNPTIAQILNSENLRNFITSTNGVPRVYDLNNPILVQKKLDAVVKSVGGNAVLIIQNSKGEVLGKIQIPKTEKEVIDYINQKVGK